MFDTTTEGTCLAMEALLYYSQSLPEHQRQAFEDRLADDQHAREALCQAVALVHACLPEPAAGPDPAYRARLKHYFLPRRGRWRSFGSLRSCSGHPLLWLLGGTAAGLVFAMLTNLFAPPATPVAAALPEPVQRVTGTVRPAAVAPPANDPCSAMFQKAELELKAAQLERELAETRHEVAKIRDQHAKDHLESLLQKGKPEK